ncbi:MAG: serine dehydratase subunit alpha family protein [Lachnospiraceae bacterium]|nr:serine dehydratase subunit alpha family protein [Lachnospiraceae bacterium]
MERTGTVYQAYVQILKEELVPAMGCTEPIALAYCAAKAREVLGCLPDRCQVRASGNIVKNVKSVIVPNTGGLKGIEAACAAGAAAGDASRVLEVIAGVTEEQKQGIREFLDRVPIEVAPLETEEILDMVVILSCEDSWAKVRIAGYHTNIVLIEKDGKVLYEKGVTADKEVSMADRSLLSIEGIYDFAKTACLEDVKELLSRQIACNSAISREGLNHDWGANIGSTLLKACGNDVRTRARAAAAAGSDARMSGCEMPVIINSGSGNQGMTASLPVIEYAGELGASEEMLYRALILSNLITIHQKTGIGRLSAYCGAVSAGCGAGCGIAFLLGGDFKAIAHTLVNALAIVSGIICDGAKPSCAGKIAAAVDAGILGYDMYQNGQQFKGGDGIISKGVENTIINIGRLGKEGMKETDKEIIRIMTGC